MFKPKEDLIQILLNRLQQCKDEYILVIANRINELIRELKEE